MNEQRGDSEKETWAQRETERERKHISDESKSPALLSHKAGIWLGHWLRLAHVELR